MTVHHRALFLVVMSMALPAFAKTSAKTLIKPKATDLQSGEVDIYAAPAGTKKLLTLIELRSIVDKQGLALKLAREELNNIDEQFISSRRQFQPKAALSSTYSFSGSTTPASEYAPETESISKSAGLNLAITGQIVQGLSYSLTSPAFSRTMSMVEAPLMLSEMTGNYKDSSQVSSSLTANLIKGSYWVEGRFASRKIEIERLTGRENFRAATIRAHIEAEQAFYDVIQKQIRMRISERSLEASKKIAEDLKEMVAVGESDKISLLRSEQQISNSEIDLNAGRTEYSDSREKLREILSMKAEEFEGVYPDAREILKLPPAPSMSNAQAIAIAMANRPDLKIQDLSLEKQNLDTQVSGLNRLPNLDLSVSYSKSGTGQGFAPTTDAALKGGARTLSVSLATSYQLIGNTDFDSFRKAKIALEKARLGRDKVVNQVSKEITSNLQRLKIAYIRLGHAKSNRDISATKAGAEYEKFIVGESDNKNLIEAQKEVTQSRITELQAYIEVRNTISSLSQALGNPTLP